MTTIGEILNKFNVDLGLEEDVMNIDLGVVPASEFTGYHTEDHDGKTIHVFEIDPDEYVIGELLFDLKDDSLEIVTASKDKETGEYEPTLGGVWEIDLKSGLMFEGM